ncbi:hypothetical protein EVAR_17750_1 [Eumeta japonica]|uniref:Uncharacterized protein n=1 Tax=Eumeta variegata TaxID=151549 RepID=A0A4C1TTX8_EUMVA|nr:hypothetical protein EVAR_17750_1 [Eumeta japonica]
MGSRGDPFQSRPLDSFYAPRRGRACATHSHFGRDLLMISRRESVISHPAGIRVSARAHRLVTFLFSSRARLQASAVVFSSAGYSRVGVGRRRLRLFHNKLHCVADSAVYVIDRRYRRR